MRGPGKKASRQEFGKSGLSERETESELISSLQFKKRSNMSCSRKPKAKVKSHAKRNSTNLSKTKRKATGAMSSKKRASMKLQDKIASVVSPEGDGKHISEDVKVKKLRKRRKKKQKNKVELDEASRLQRRTRYLLIKMKLEQNLIDAYSTEGWKGHSREKIRPEKELERARKQILKCKLGIRDAIHQLDSLSSVGSIEDTAIAPDGSVYHEHIFCAKCKLREAFPDNDIVLCDGTCNCAFHQKCLDPPLDTENIPPGDQGWFCKFCVCKIEIIEAMNAHIGTHFPVDSNWQDIFKEEAALPDDGGALLNQEEEWPSDDSEDDDYDPERREKSCSASEVGTDEDASDNASSSTSLSWSLDGEAFSGSGTWELEGDHYRSQLVDSSANSAETSDAEIIHSRRQRRAVDYKKLYDEMFGKEALPYEQISEDEDWGPHKRRRREKESDAVSTLMTLHESEKKSPNIETVEVGEKLSPDDKARRTIFRIPPNAVEKLRQAFAENELPSRTIKENLSKELGLEPDKVSKWFKNARYIALRTRKAEGAKQHNSSPQFLEESGLQLCNTENPDDVVMENNSAEGENSIKIHEGVNQNRRGSLRKSNKINLEFNDDMSLKKLLKAKRKENKKVGIAAGHRWQAFEVEMERLYRAKVRLDNMKHTLLKLKNQKARNLNKSQLLEESVIYVPVAELKEKA